MPGAGNSPVLPPVIDALQRRVGALSSGGVVGAGVYFETRQVWQALLACVLGPPAVAGGKILAEWVRLLTPPRRWRRSEDAEPNPAVGRRRRRSSVP
jgi:hypothetical protein